MQTMTCLLPQRFRGAVSLGLLALAGLAAPAQAQVGYQGPIVVNSNGGNPITITGNYQSTDPNTPAITINTTDPVTILNCNVMGPGKLISTTGPGVFTVGARLTVKNTNGYGDIGSGAYGQPVGQFIYAYQPVSVDIEHNYCDHTEGIIIQDNGDNVASPRITNSVKILYNQVHNTDGRWSNGSGGYIGSFDANDGGYTGPDGLDRDYDNLAHSIQVAYIRCPNIEIGWNESVNDWHNSIVSDIINVYRSQATNGNHILIHDNYLQGSYNPSGTGINAGDGTEPENDQTNPNGDTAATTPAYVDCHDNQAVAIENSAIAIEAGHDISVHNNRAVSSGYAPDGTFYPTTYSNGLICYDERGQGASIFYNNDVQNNYSAYVSNRGGPNQSPWWLPGVRYSDGNSYPSANPTLNDEAVEYQSWMVKLGNNDLVTGNAAAPSGLVRVTNVGNGNDINTQTGLQCTASQPGWWSAEWTFVPTGDGYYQIQNRWTSGYLNVENGLACGSISPGAWSAQWAVVPAGNGYYRIMNRWTGAGLNTQNGGFQCSTVQTFWGSAEWTFEAAS